MSKELVIPTIDEIINPQEDYYKQNQLMVILNQPPPKKWIKTHPMTKGFYLPIERVEYLLNRVFVKWWVDIKNTQVLANSVVVTVRLFVINPLTKETDFNDGLGASPIQTDKGAGAMDWNSAKNDGVMKAAPAAESYAIKDAAEKFGKLFGKDLNRKDEIGYDSLLKQQPEDQLEELKELFDLFSENLKPDDALNIERIIEQKETASYKKAISLLKKFKNE